MGIINITPDSFYDGGKTFSPQNILLQAEKMLADGATFLDIGGYSSRPGAENVSTKEEIDRVLKALDVILQNYPDNLISVDTFRSEVAKAVAENEAALINDISGGTLDPKMYKVVGELKIPYILMHMKGTPQNMATLTDYENVTTEVLEFLSKKIVLARA